MKRKPQLLLTAVFIIVCANSCANPSSSAKDSGALPNNDAEHVSSKDAASLARYRGKTLIYLVNARLKSVRTVTDIAFETEDRAKLARKEGGIMGWLMIRMQGDRVDFSKARFKIDNAPTTQCFLYVREDGRNMELLHVNLQKCTGPHSLRLSGSPEYGLRLLKVNKAEL